MQINKNYISNQNSYENNNPLWIVIHNTDNFSRTADAKAHARAQHDGNLSGMSAHYYVDDSGVYQALPHNRGAWHVGVNYGGKLFGTVNNRNSIGIEMCVNAGYNYEKALRNSVTLTKQLMQELGIDTDHVVSHYDVCAKNCPSQIRAKGDWARFKKLIGASGENICGIAISDSNVEAISKVVYGEAGVIRSYNALLGVAQCIYDMRQSGRYGKTVTEVMQRNFAAYGSKETTEEARQAVYDVFCKGVRRYPDAQILQFRSFTKYSDGAGNMDKQKCADLLRQYEYLGKDARDNRWGHLYFGRKVAAPEPVNKQIKVQAGSFAVKDNAYNVAAKIKKAGFPAIVKKEEGQYKVQCGAFDIRSNAEKLVQQLEAAGFEAIIE
ncbi:N-acetylmuramoyl-L-alanine amidase [Bacteroides acidifaciens]|uniref:N-acetylmuramoyl-L-alanine amidase n=1 Tax=Bacteroides acidifaciens TaxID=85831 RepID=UPI0025B1ACC7|nr:N-acetylmuramoyl-L-alanine amidase [Bacteroides acidifaciens]